MIQFFSRILAAGIAIVLAGCASTYPHFTDEARERTDLSRLRFYVGNTIEFRSTQVLDSVVQEGPFKPDGRRWHRIATTDPGRVVAMGQDWLAVDFGKGIVLRFTLRSPSNDYWTPGWGTFTIDGERYDMMVGVLSGSDVPLLYDPTGFAGADSTGQSPSGG